MSPGGQGHPQLRTTALDAKNQVNESYSWLVESAIEYGVTKYVSVISFIKCNKYGFFKENICIYVKCAWKNAVFVTLTLIRPMAKLVKIYIHEKKAALQQDMQG